MNMSTKILAITYLALTLSACPKSPPGGRSDPAAQGPGTSVGPGTTHVANTAHLPPAQEASHEEATHLTGIDGNSLSPEMVTNNQPPIFSNSTELSRLGPKDVEKNDSDNNSTALVPYTGHPLVTEEFGKEVVHYGEISIHPDETLESTVFVLFEADKGPIACSVFHSKRVGNLILGFLPQACIDMLKNLPSSKIPSLIGKSLSGFMKYALKFMTWFSPKEAHPMVLVVFELNASPLLSAETENPIVPYAPAIDLLTKAAANMHIDHDHNAHQAADEHCVDPGYATRMYNYIKSLGNYIYAKVFGQA